MPFSPPSRPRTSGGMTSRSRCRTSNGAAIGHANWMEFSGPPLGVSDPQQGCYGEARKIADLLGFTRKALAVRFGV